MRTDDVIRACLIKLLHYSGTGILVTVFKRILHRTLMWWVISDLHSDRKRTTGLTCIREPLSLTRVALAPGLVKPSAPLPPMPGPPSSVRRLTLVSQPSDLTSRSSTVVSLQLPYCDLSMASSHPRYEHSLSHTEHLDDLYSGLISLTLNCD